MILLVPGMSDRNRSPHASRPRDKSESLIELGRRFQLARRPAECRDFFQATRFPQLVSYSGNSTRRLAVEVLVSSMTGTELPQFSPDADFARLPSPRRPFRRITLLVMLITAGFSSWLALGLRGDFAYALQSGPPRELGELVRIPSQELPANRWVRAEGTLESRDVVRFYRPLDRDARRLARVEGNPNLWVELRVPPEADGDRFVQPGSFVGRLVPVSEAGLRYGALASAVSEAGKLAPSAGSYLLLDGESPTTTRWVLGLMLLLVGFALFNLLGIVRLARPVRDV